MPDWKPLEKDTVSVAHLSDLHFGSSKAEEVWGNIAKFLMVDLRPDLILISGDIVHTISQKNYLKAKSALDNLRIPFFICAGNHDRFVLGNHLRLRTLLNSGWLGQFFTITISVIVLLLAVVAWMSLGWVVGACFFSSVLLLIGLVWTVEKLLGKKIANALFDQTFQTHILSPEQFQPQVLGSRERGNEWKIGLLGLDSCLHADCFARGRIPIKELLSLDHAAQAIKEADVFDLCMLLVHHHLLPVRLLEDNQDDKANDLIDATSLVNSGTLLEKLSQVLVDLVLHGHEHKHNWATYSSLVQGYGPVRVIGAGSATGNDSSKGCKEQDSSMNLIELRADRSVHLNRVFLEAGTWKTEFEHGLVLLTPAEVRQAMIRRKIMMTPEGHPRRDVKTEITKCFVFTRERDIEVNWIMTDWCIEEEEFTYPVWNSTGAPVEPIIKLSENGKPQEFKEAYFKQSKQEDHIWILHWKVPKQFLKKSVTIEIHFRWQGGGILTREELDNLKKKKGELDTPRKQGYEYATIWTKNKPVAALNLHVTLPLEYATKDIQLAIDAGNENNIREAEELRKDLHILAAGRYSLRIPFPRIDAKYTLLWEPVREKIVSQIMQDNSFYTSFCKAAEERGDELLQTFSEVFKETWIWGNSTIALFIKEKKAKCVAYIPLGPRSPSGYLQNPFAVSFDLAGESNPLVKAWRGSAETTIRPEDETEAEDAGFLPREGVVLCIPIRFGLGDVNPPPWGVVRIGVAKTELTEEVVLPSEIDDTKKTALALPSEEGTVKMRVLLQVATLHLLSKSLQ